MAKLSDGKPGAQAPKWLKNIFRWIGKYLTSKRGW